MEVHPIIDSVLATVRPKENKTMIEYLSIIESYENQFDDGIEITEEAYREHFDAITDLKLKTDKLIMHMENLKMKSADYAAKAQAYKERSIACENNLKRVKDYAKFLMTRFPDAKFAGNKGSLALQRTAKKLVLTMPKYRFSTESQIPPEYVDAVPEEFRKLNVVWVFNNEAIREALNNGSETPIGRLEENNFVKIKL